MITKKHVNRVLRLQCFMVGAPFKSISPDKPNWFLEYSWTMKREALFVDLLTTYLWLSRRARLALTGNGWRFDGRCRGIANEWAWQYGWKYKD